MNIIDFKRSRKNSNEMDIKEIGYHMSIYFESMADVTKRCINEI